MKSQLSNAYFGMFMLFLVTNLQNVLYLHPLGAKVSNQVPFSLRLSEKGSYDPKEAYKHTCGVWDAIRIFYHGTQSQASCLQKSIF